MFSSAPSFKQYRGNNFIDKPRFNGVFSRNNVITIDDKNSKRTHWLSLFIHKNVAIYFDSFGI